jgi:hypothetical protein
MLNEVKLIGRPARDTPSELETTPGYRRPLPPDLLRQVSRRLQIMTLVGAGLWILGVSLGHVADHTLNPEGPRWAQINLSDLIAAGSVALSLALFFYLRKGDRDPAAVINLSLAYMIVTALAIAVMLHWGMAPSEKLDPQPMITWIGAGDPHVRGHCPCAALEVVSGWISCRLDGSDRHGARTGRWSL